MVACYRLIQLHKRMISPAITRDGPERMGSRPPHWVPLLKSYGSSILSTSLGSKTLNTSSLGLGRNQNQRPGCRRHLAGIFHTPARCLQA